MEMNRQWSYLSEFGCPAKPAPPALAGGQGMVDGSHNDTKPKKDGEQNDSIHRDPRKPELRDVEKRIKIDAKGRATQHAIEEIQDREDEPPGGIAPSQHALSQKRQPIEGVQERDGIMQRNVGEKLQSTRVP